MSTARLQALCAVGGLADAAALRFETPAHGRIHEVHIVRGAPFAFVLQRVNTSVVSAPDALARVTALALPPAIAGSAMLTWPATGTVVLDIDGQAWIRRPYVDGRTPAQPLASGQLRAMARALHAFHDRIDIVAFEDCGFASVNPWSGAAGSSLERRVTDPAFRADADERIVIDRLVRAWRRLAESSASIGPGESGAGRDGTARSVISHRDPKPSNFVERHDGCMVLIDFDTVGPGPPAQDLGELLRALVTADESGERASTPGINCRQAAEDLASGYADASIDARRIRHAGCLSCLWQCERYLDDHFRGDLHYRVERRGDNRRRALEQLDGFERIAGRASARWQGRAGDGIDQALQGGP